MAIRENVRRKQKWAKENERRERQREEAKRQQEQHFQQRLHATLREWGLWESFRDGLNSKQQRALELDLAAGGLHVPAIFPTPAVTQHARFGEVQSVVDHIVMGVNEAARQPAPQADWWEVSFPVFHAIYRSLRDTAVRPPFPGVPKGHLDAIVRRHDLLCDVRLLFGKILTEGLARFNRVDAGIFTVGGGFIRLNCQPRPRLVVYLNHHPAQKIHLESDRGVETLYRAAAQEVPARGMSGLWIDWPPSVFGGAGNGKDYPVYAQAHVFHQLEARLDLPWLADLLHYHLGLSLRAPKIIPVGADEYLVEFRVNRHEVGYLVAVRMGEMVVVKTFLLITMLGTPEGDRLGSKLGVQPADLRTLDLNRLSTYFNSDVRTDPVLTRLLREAGCGDVFAVGGPSAPAVLEARAAEIREYLGLPEMLNAP